MRTFMRVFVVGASIAALTATAQQTALAAPTENSDVLAAMQRDLGLTAAQSTQLRARQDRAVAVDSGLRTSLGTAYAGSWFDPATGALNVNVSDPARTLDVVRAGARGHVVEHSGATLEAIKTELDTAADAEDSSSTDGLASWHTDPKTNSVVVSVVKGQHPAALDALGRHGDAVEVEYVDQAPETTKWINGGEVIYSGGSRCSAGFNLNDPATGQTYMLTAGHCVEPGDDVDGEDHEFFGTVTESFFPHWDHALVKAENASYWQQGPYVQSDAAHGGYITVGQPQDLPVGTAMCKYGSTTAWTCGTILAKDETVNYSGVAEPVLYLTRTNACTEPGDSGGANVGYGTGWTAEGVTSGGALVEVDGRKRCRAAAGLDNISFYYPVAKALAWYGPRFNVRVM
ncbi:S1 family peptidase [Umezawaea sp. Da 62-37]|uniref:S1 family peptidase n=1 Tax=Umezawaea sp. Da 62-37 TaxID=3075927 RepID=UPI0028F72C89|nr:S1 family peptidase [Umezawaea sp. Da 62-37]WNV86977.1 S1 family peptidase [Umezawaea sp. Da 62-37]